MAELFLSDIVFPVSMDYEDKSITMFYILLAIVWSQVSLASLHHFCLRVSQLVILQAMDGSHSYCHIEE